MCTIPWTTPPLPVYRLFTLGVVTTQTTVVVQVVLIENYSTSSLGVINLVSWIPLHIISLSVVVEKTIYFFKVEQISQNFSCYRHCDNFLSI